MRLTRTSCNACRQRWNVSILFKGLVQEVSQHVPFSRANLIHPELIETTCAAFPRKGWSEVFAKTIEKEEHLKPWCHTTTFELTNWQRGMSSQFATDVRNNSVMAKYE